MSTPDVVVYVDLDRETHMVGHLWLTKCRGGSLAFTFRYAESWLECGFGFAVDPPLHFEHADLRLALES